MDNNQKRYYRPKEAAKYLGVSLSTIWRYVNQGRLTCKKLSPRITVFEIDEVNDLSKYTAMGA